MTTLRGKVSWFGGPEDGGVSPDEGLAFIYSVEDAPHLFLDYQPEGTTGLARRLNPEVPYIACRWDYEQTPKEMLPDMRCAVRAPKTGRTVTNVYPADWGPHVDTGRVADISPGLMEALGITTDDEVEVTFQPTERAKPSKPGARSICISSGHGLKVRGASGILDEVDEARRVVDRVAGTLMGMGVDVTVVHDNVSQTQDQNLKYIVDAHNNAPEHDIDVSVHFNAYETTSKPMGTEVLYVTQEQLAEEFSAAIAKAGGLIDRGPKYRDNLYFLNKTDEPSILIEVCFVDSQADADAYRSRFIAICNAIAAELAFKEWEGVA